MQFPRHDTLAADFENLHMPNQPADPPCTDHSFSSQLMHFPESHHQSALSASRKVLRTPLGSPSSLKSFHLADAILDCNQSNFVIGSPEKTHKRPFIEFLSPLQPEHPSKDFFCGSVGELIHATEWLSGDQQLSVLSDCDTHPRSLAPKLAKPRVVADISEYKVGEFDRFMEFLREHLYLAGGNAGEQLRRLSPKNKTLFKLYLRRVFSVRMPILENFGQDEFDFGFQAKRREQRFNFVYKFCLKRLRRQFIAQHSQVGQTYKQNYPDYAKSVFNNVHKLYYFWLFHETIASKAQPVDLVMHIVCANVSGSKSVSRSNNWRWKKFGAVKTVTPLLRFLIQADAVMKGRMLSILSAEPGSDMMRQMRRSVAAKLRKKHKLWASLVVEAGNDFDRFRDAFESSITEKKSKLPWTMAEIRESILFCIHELKSQSKALRAKFTRVKSMHYSSRNLRSFVNPGELDSDQPELPK